MEDGGGGGSSDSDSDGPQIQVRTDITTGAKTSYYIDRFELRQLTCGPIPWRPPAQPSHRVPKSQPGERGYDRQAREAMAACDDHDLKALLQIRVSDEDGALADALKRRAAVADAAAAARGEHSPSFFERFALEGIRVESIRPGHILCSFTVPARLTAGSSHIAPGAVVALVDEIGSAVSVSDGQHLKVSVDMSVSFVDLSAAALGDALRITARALGHKGAYSGTHVLVANAATGQVVAEGRHSLFGKLKIRSNI